MLFGNIIILQIGELGDHFKNMFQFLHNYMATLPGVKIHLNEIHRTPLGRTDKNTINNKRQLIVYFPPQMIQLI
jgi:hypothetical protein